MRIVPSVLPGVTIIEPEPLTDERGFFARTMCREMFLKFNLNPDFVQQSVSFTKQAHAIRGMHFQAAPYAEDKLVRVVSGCIFDVALDLRRESPTYRKWFGIELSGENRKALYIPKGCAHGFQALTENTEMFYQMTAPFHPGSSRGVRWNDPAFSIAWPHPETALLNDRDRNYPDFDNAT